MAAAFLYSWDEVAGKPVVIAGVDLAATSQLTQYWHVEGSRGDCLAGISLGLKVGETVRLQKYSCVVNGVVSTGGAEDASGNSSFCNGRAAGRRGGCRERDSGPHGAGTGE